MLQLYFLAILPPSPLRGSVANLKEEMRARYGAGHALKSPAHITLQMPFKRAEQDEARLAGVLGTWAAAQASFPVELDGFGAFPPRVIYLRVVDHAPWQSVYASLQSMLREELGFAADELSARFHPHLTIATRDLAKKAFQEAWPLYAHRPFQASFRAEALTLLRHNGRHWNAILHFPFGT
ncbi:MAG: 2'-5' RNA ligase family protein [Lewinella sp.]|nr:2'-5' RNA ligase family protein [Lewinella sp.]